MANPLNKHDLYLMEAVVTRVTQFNIDFAKEYWSVSAIAAKRRLEKLERRGLLRSRNVLASTPPAIVSPLCLWKPGEELPHHGKISYAARKRWKRLPVVVQRVYHATDLGRGLLGRQPVNPPKDVQATHDLGVTNIYLMYRRRWPTLTKRCWLNETEYSHFRGHSVKVEDAMLRRDDSILLMVDYAGAYRPDRVEALVAHAQLHQVPIAIY